MRPTLILGGTTEASALARLMAEAGLPGILSYAGRTKAPRAQPLPVRVGGFGGAAGLARFLRAEGIGRVVDATHPFAARISGNAVAACTDAGVPLLALERPPWRSGPGDDWRRVPDIPAAAGMLAGPPRRVFLAIGRQHLAEFACQPRHRYLLRLVDPPEGLLPLPDCHAEIARGPFDAEADRALMARHRIELVVAKNAGGQGARAKLQAARDLCLPVILIDRPAPTSPSSRPVVSHPDEVIAWLHADLGV